MITKKFCLVCNRYRAIECFSAAEETDDGYCYVCSQCIHEDRERWLVVPEWENYEVSSLGRVRSLPVLRKAGRAGMRWTGGKILKQTYANYQVCVSLHNKDGRQWTPRVGNLVLRVFVRLPVEGEVCRHFLDPDPTNCRLVNLRWGTQTQNVADCTRHYGRHHRVGYKHSEETKAKLSKPRRWRLWSM